MCNKMYENVKSFDYTKKSLQSDSDPATMEMVTRTNAVKSPTNSPETTKLVYTVKEVAQMLAISQRAAYNLCNSTTEFRVLRAGGSIRSRKTASMRGSTGQLDKEANLWHISRNAAASTVSATPIRTSTARAATNGKLSHQRGGGETPEADRA